jgi:hypothetical protein
MQPRVAISLGQLLASTVLFGAITLPAHAGPDNQGTYQNTYKGWQIGAGALYGDYRLDGGAIDDSAAGFKAWGQYRFNKYLGLEVAFLSTGNFRQDTTLSEAGGGAKISAQGFSMDALGYLPFSPEAVQMFGKVGFYRLDQNLQFKGTVSTSRIADGFTAGAGADIAVARVASRQVTLRIEGDWYTLDNAKFWTVDLGVSYHFGSP